MVVPVPLRLLRMPRICVSRSIVTSGIDTPGPTRAQALVSLVCALVGLGYLLLHQNSRKL